MGSLMGKSEQFWGLNVKLARLKKSGKILLTSLLIGTMSYLAPITFKAHAEEKDKKPVIVTIDNATQEAITGEYVLNSLAKNGIDLVINIKSDDLKDDQKILDLRDLFEKNMSGVSFSINIQDEKSEKSLENKTIELSEQQKSFTQAFNKNYSNYNLVSQTLSVEISDKTTVNSMRQAAFKILVSKDKIKNGYILHENGVMEIYRDPEGSIIKDFRIKSVDELIKDVKKNLDTEDPFVITVDAEAILKEYGQDDMNFYLRDLGKKLKALQEEENIEFLTTHEFYLKHPKTVQYLILRVDDYQAFWKRDVFENIISKIMSQNVPQTIAVIPKDLHDSKQALEYLGKITKDKKVEIAIHGYDHQINEFTMALEKQVKTLEKSLEEFSHLKETSIHSIIPPLDQINEYTSEAMKRVDKKLVILSSNLNGDKQLFGLDSKGIYHISRSVDVVKKWQEPYELKTYEEILSEIGDDDVVLGIHPQIHETKENQKYLTELIMELKKNPKLKFVTLYEFYQTVMPK